MGKNGENFGVEPDKEVIDDAKTKGAKVHFATILDMCHLKNADLETKHQKYKCRVVLRGDIVKDDSGFYAVFTKHGSPSITNDSSKKSWISSPDCRVAINKQQTQYRLKPR